ncbi:unnamed protein product [Pieris macdunnoughi]|uniref:Uncharacterized protein n=1 Tax=Pieris macdunnoughi TaxID=345717 RepID=A0A821S508_9NEOP|nr:unnamed protein product [Pieris macdunnoughi]
MKLEIRVLWLLPCLSLCLKPNSVLYKEIFEYHNETFFKAEYAYEVVTKIFNAYKQWFFTITFCEFTYFENRILKYIENYGDGYPVMLLSGCPDTNNTKVKPKINKHGQTAYVVTSNDLSIEESEFAIEAFIRTGVFQPRAAVIFVIKTPVQVDSYFFYTMKNHFELLWKRKVTNSVLVLWSEGLRIYAYNIFYKEIKDITDVKYVNEIFARQFDDLFGHELRISVFRKIYTNNNTGAIDCSSRLVHTIVETFNATCKPLPPRDGNTVGDLLENGTATGVTADLIDGYSDLELNSRILKTSYYGYIDTTYPLVQDELCFLIKKSKKQSTFTTTLKLISTEMLVLLMCNVVLFIAITLMVRKVEMQLWQLNDNRTTSETILDLFKCFIRQTVELAFSGQIFRCVVLMIMLYSLVVDCAIDGIITSAIAYPRYKPDINTLSELFKTNLTFGVHTRHMGIFNNSLSDEYYEKIHERIEIVSDQKIKEIIDQRKFEYALLLRRSEALYLSNKPSNLVGSCSIGLNLMMPLKAMEILYILAITMKENH